jgi:predicted Zn-dependent peptidase
MESKEFNGLDLTYYKEVLNNGLEVYLIPMSNKKNYYINYATKFGSDITNFVPIDKKEEVIVPDGIAHFLEHKMFEQESGEDPFTFFSTSGTDSNAMTDYTSTQYICTGTKKFKENLEYLLQFVNSPYYTDENVEKEKGIILEEERMTKDNPDRLFFETIYKNLFNKIPYDKTVIGTRKDISSITKEDLYKCYNTFYNPSNMVLFVVSNRDKK